MKTEDSKKKEVRVGAVGRTPRPWAPRPDDVYPANIPNRNPRTKKKKIDEAIKRLQAAGRLSYGIKD